MTNPVPGYSVSTAWHLPNTGYWNACNWHTGQDYAAPKGTPIVAARGGAVVHVAMGPAFGDHQFIVRPGDGTQDFYAHTSTRPGNGTHVAIGAHVATVGAEGNVSGPHLHLERHGVISESWPPCSAMQDPMLSHSAGGEVAPPTGWLLPSGTQVYRRYLKYKGHELNADGVSDSVKAWQDMLNHHSIPGGEILPVTGQWFDMTSDETRLCQRSHVPPEDTPYPEGIFVGPTQWEHVRSATGCPYVWVDD